uniref:DUF148 domain-containing protein n=1 Tax=Strongyloides stercoralis TaxID=6248 RepID=A0A0K0E7C8_STRER
MKYLSLIILAAITLTCYTDDDYFKYNNPLYMSLTRNQLRDIERIEDNDRISPNEKKQQILNYLTTQGGNYASLYNDYVANQTSLMNEAKQIRLELINNSTMSDAAKNAQKQIDQISSNENLSKNEKKTQIRQVKSNLNMSVLRELDDFEDGRMNPISTGYILGRTNNGLRSNYYNKKMYEFDFDDLYEITSDSINELLSRARRHV